MTDQHSLSDVQTILIAAPALQKSNRIAVLEKEKSYRLIFAGSAEALLQRIVEEHIDMIIVQLDLEGLDMTDLVIKVRSLDADIPILVLANHNRRRISETLWRAGIDDGVCTPILETELAHRVARALRLRRLIKQHAKLVKENKGLWKLSVTDGLTKLVNRRYFNEIMDNEFNRVKRFGGELGMILADIDHFKKVNDNHGHQAGDYVLQEVARIMREAVRSIDTVARYGGEEFIFLMPETTGDGLIYVAEKLRKLIAGNNFRAGLKPQDPGPDRITISLGAVDYPAFPAKSPGELVEKVDQALYQAKNTGRNKVVALPI
ncbi:MAG: GGDEF domain-containing response regulator [Calditrichota bacterium]